MTRPLVYVDAGEGIDRVAAIMAEKGIRRVLVEKDGRVLGVIRNQTIVRRMRDYIDAISSQIARAQLPPHGDRWPRSEEHTSELQSRPHLVCRLLLEKKKNRTAPAGS